MPCPPEADKPIRVLCLQGPPSPFARELGAELTARGAEVLRINLCIGDWIYWHGPGTLNYRGSLANWESYLERLLVERGITDIVYFADQVPYHRIARRVAERLGIRGVSYEHGYLRPDWIVVEPGGQSAYSHLSEDPEQFKAVAKTLPDPDFGRLYQSDFKAESNGEVVYHLSNYLGWLLYPRFVRDRVYNPLIEYAVYPFRFRHARRNKVRSATQVDRLQMSATPYFVVILQMQNDYQIRTNSPYSDQRGYISDILTSFAADAPKDAELVVKVHPLDNGLVNWRRHLKREAQRLGVLGRVLYLDGGDLERLVAGAKGTITINSTSGLTALRALCPLRVAGIAVYDMPGLTHQGPMSRFWSDPDPPDQETVWAFLKVLASAVHVRGDFYGLDGRRAAARSFAAKLVERRIGGAIFKPHPPRLGRARRIGVPVRGWPV